MSLPPEFHSTVFLLGDPAGPLPAAFAIITAWNPEGVTVDEATNEIADQVLRRELEELGLPFQRVTGCSPDLAHQEPGWAAPLSKVEAIALGRRHRQLAVWWVRDDQLDLVDCRSGEAIRIARFPDRVVAS